MLQPLAVALFHGHASLDAWITECNRGRNGCFVADWDAVLAGLPVSAS